MELGQPKPFRILNHHDCCPRDINTHLNHRGPYQQIDEAISESFHDPVFFIAGHTAVNQFHSKTRHKNFTEFFVHFQCVFQVHLF